KPVAGIFPLSGPEFEGVPESWMSYLAVDDVDVRLKAAKAAGARVMREPFDVPDVGRIAILTEPGGAGIGWITPVGDEYTHGCFAGPVARGSVKLIRPPPGNSADVRGMIRSTP